MGGSRKVHLEPGLGQERSFAHCVASSCGFDVEYAAQVLFDPIDGRVSMGVYTPRARRFRIISARKANAREVQAYERHTQDP